MSPQIRGPVPEPDLGDAQFPAEDDPELDGLPGIDALELEDQVPDLHRSVCIYDSLHPEAEDVLRREEGRRDHELAEQAPLFFLGSMEADGRDLSGGAVDLPVIISILLSLENLPALIDRSDILSGAGSDEPILQPSIGPLDLAFRLRRERMPGLDSELSNDLFPLGVDLVGQEVVGSPVGVPPLDEAEDGVGVGVEAERDSPA